MKTLKNLTVLLMTVPERHKYLRRLFTYYRDLHCRKIVIDSSPYPYSKIAEFPDIEYYQEPGMGAYKKLMRGLHLIDTEYILQVADDDFAVIKGIKEGLEFLLANPDYSFVNGQQVRFNETQNPQVFDNYGSWQYRKQLKDNYCSNNPINRINYMFDTFFAPNHTILKTKILQKSCQLIVDFPHLKPVRYFDKIVGYIAAVEGNFKMMPILLQLRSGGDRLINTDPNLFPGSDLPFITLVDRLKTYGDPLSLELAKSSGLSFKKAQKITLSIFEEYANNPNSTKTKEQFLLLRQFKKKLAQKLFKKNPNEEKKFISPLDSGEYQDEIDRILYLVKNYTDPPILNSKT